MTILPSIYLPSIEYFAHLAQKECTIDIGEHYIKRSERNRARIMTAAGVMELSVNVRNANRPQQPMSTIEIDYSKRWAHQHWVAILSAYKSSPYYDHYAHHFEEIFSTPHRRLVDLNWTLTQKLIKLFKLTPHITISDVYVEANEEDVDLRPKGRLSMFSHEPYIQVFCDRTPFVENLSALDLLFCEGSHARDILESSCI